MVIPQNNDTLKQCRTLNDFFSGLQNKELEILQQNLREIVFQKNETLIKQQTFVSHILYIKSGLIKLYIEGTSGKNLILKIITPNNFLGVTSLHGANYHQFTAVVLKKADVCMIEKQAFLKILASNKNLSLKLNEWHSENYQYLFNKLHIIGTKQLHGRLAETILYLCSPELTEHNIFNYITRKDISELAAMSLESMNRLLAEYRDDKLIIYEGKAIKINDYEMIKKLSAAG